MLLNQSSLFSATGRHLNCHNLSRILKEKLSKMIIYVGPDQIIPLSGFLGTAAGLALMFWGKLMQGFRKVAAVLTSQEPQK